MTDELQPPSMQAGTSVPPVSSALAVYALYGLAALVSLVSAGLHMAPLWSIVGVVGLIIAYVKLGEARGTWVESHLRYLVRTFWWGLLFAIIGWTLGWLFAVTVIGIPIAILLWIAPPIWVIYRLVRGYLSFKDSKPVPA